MPKGIPAAGFRVTNKRMQSGWVPGAVQSIIPSVPAPMPVVVLVETDEQIVEKLNKRFDALERLTKATVDGLNRALIVSGPAGLGKSYTVEKVISENATRNFTFVRGYVRPTGLYRMMYEHREENDVIVFDDSDSIFDDAVSMNLLKVACDTTETRVLSWLAETRMEDEDGERLPRSFVFKGTIIFITNIDMDTIARSGNKMAPHFEAMVSRSMYIDLAMKTKRDYLIRIKQVVGSSTILNCLTEQQRNDVVQYIEENVETLRELSLRMVIKIATLVMMDNDNWKASADIACKKYGVRF